MAEKNNSVSKNKGEIKNPAPRILSRPANPSSGSIARIALISILVLVFVALLALLLFWLQFLIFLVVVSIFFAYLLNPLVGFVRRPFETRNLEKFMPRSAAIIISYLIVFVVLGIAIGSLMPMVVEQTTDFAAHLPQYGSQIQERITELINRYEQLKIPVEVQQDINQRVAGFIQYFGLLITSFVGVFAVSTITYLPWVILVPVLAFFFLKDANLYRNMFLACFPSGRWRARAESFVGDINLTLAAYTSAQIISCLLVGLICTLAFTLIGLDYALLLGLLAGVLEFIPLLGPIIMGIIVILVTIISGNPAQAFWATTFLVILRFVQSFLIYPRIVRDRIHLNPLAVIMSVLAGQLIAGISGVFLSIPFVAVITILYKHIFEHSGRRGLFTEIFGSDDTTAGRSDVEIKPTSDA